MKYTIIPQISTIIDLFVNKVLVPVTSLLISILIILLVFNRSIILKNDILVVWIMGGCLATFLLLAITDGLLWKWYFYCKRKQKTLIPEIKIAK